MIFFAPAICWYVFWKSFYKEFGIDFDFPVIENINKMMTVCGEI